MRIATRVGDAEQDQCKHTAISVHHQTGHYILGRQAPILTTTLLRSLIHRCGLFHPRSPSPYPPLLACFCGSYLTQGMDAMAMRGLTIDPVIALLVCNRVSMLSYGKNFEG
jgi:hypothetical protein